MNHWSNDRNSKSSYVQLLNQSSKFIFSLFWFLSSYDQQMYGINQNTEKCNHTCDTQTTHTYACQYANKTNDQPSKHVNRQTNKPNNPSSGKQANKQICNFAFYCCEMIYQYDILKIFVFENGLDLYEFVWHWVENSFIFMWFPLRLHQLVLKCIGSSLALTKTHFFFTPKLLFQTTVKIQGL